METGGAVRWLIGEFIPFGDLVSDLVLIATLPSTDDADRGSSYQFMSWALWVGTLISSIPEIAIIVGVLTGLAVGAILGPATHSAHGEGREVLSSTFDQTITLVRYVCSDSKAITRFVLYFTKDVPPGWNNAATLAARYVLLVPLFPLAYPLVKLWGMVSSHHDDAARPWYVVLIFVQVLGGLMTEISSIYFAVSTNNSQSIVSALFGMYSLLVSTLIHKLKGPKNPDEKDSFARRSQKLAAKSRKQMLHYGAIGVALVVGLGVLIMAFLGVYFIRSCEDDMICDVGSVDEGNILASVGFIVMGFLWLFLLVSAYNGVGARVVNGIEPVRAVVIVFFSGLGIVLTGLGIVFAIFNNKVDQPLYDDDSVDWKISDFQSRVPPERVIALLFFGCLSLFVIVPAAYLPLYCRTVDKDGPVAGGPVVRGRSGPGAGVQVVLT